MQSYINHWAAGSLLIGRPYGLCRRIWRSHIIEIMTRLLLARPVPERRKTMAIPTIDMVGTGQNIQRLRQAAGVSVKDLQDVFGFSTPQAIYKWQHGTALPTIDNLVVLAAILGVKIDDILVTTDMQVSVSA